MIPKINPIPTILPSMITGVMKVSGCPKIMNNGSMRNPETIAKIPNMIEILPISVIRISPLIKDYLY